MVDWVVVAVCISLIVLCGIVFFGAPFLPTKKAQITAALDLLNLKKGQLVLDLGAGDGRVALAAARRGLRVRGYELNGLLALVAKIRTWPYRHSVSIKWQNYWQADLSEADGVFIFSASRFMRRLDKKLAAAGKPLRLASIAFKVPGKKIVEQLNGVFLYQYGRQKPSGKKR